VSAEPLSAAAKPPPRGAAARRAYLRKAES